MNDPIREQLIGYLLGALDEHEQRMVERQLATDETWQRELQAIQECLEPLAEGYEGVEPPPGLAMRACSFVAQERQSRPVSRPIREIRITEGGFDFRSRWTLADWGVMAGICLAAALLFFPALLNSRFSARLAACQNNLRELGMDLTAFSELSPEGVFPAVATTGNRAFAGVYASHLQEAGLLRDARLVICPESGMAAEAERFRIPTLCEIDEATGHNVLILQKTAGGTYASSLGFLWNGRHMPPRNLGRTYFVIMADAPSFERAGRPAHGHGMNLLYEDLHIRFMSEQQQLPVRDNPLCNHFGRCEAGVDMNDDVVAPSYFPPLMTNNVSLVHPE